MGQEELILDDLIKRYPLIDKAAVWAAYDRMRLCFELGGKLLVCGNGGSAADAEHIVGELMKGFRWDRKLPAWEKEKFSHLEGGRRLADKLQRALPAISLGSQSALLTAVGNDNTWEMSFAQQVYGYGEQGDILLALSTTGESDNVDAAARTARIIGMQVISVTGAGGSRLSAVSHICLRLPGTETYLVQEYTMPVYHALCSMLEYHFFVDES